MGAEEGGVADVFFQAFFCADVDAVPFEVDAEEIMVRVHLCEPDGIFPLAAGQLEREGMVIFEKGGPSPGHSLRVLQDIREAFDGFEADQFLLAHWRQK